MSALFYSMPTVMISFDKVIHKSLGSLKIRDINHWHVTSISLYLILLKVLLPHFGLLHQLYYMNDLNWWNLNLRMY